MLPVILVLLVLAALAWVVLSRGKTTPPPEVLPSQPAVLPPEDETEAERREIDTVTLQAARAAVTTAIPDAVLADALQNTDTRQLAQAFAHVDATVIAAAMGQTPVVPDLDQARPEDLKQLKGAGQAVEDLDIWSFGDS